MIRLHNATITDATGEAPRAGDILMRDGIIVEMGEMAQTMDCTGLGFIDIHSHSDLQVLANHRAKAGQAVTPEVAENCGFSPYPFRHHHQALHQSANGIFCGWDDWGWSSAREYLYAVHHRAKLSNVLSLTGHGSLRIAHMDRNLSECLADGSAGLSTGLLYATNRRSYSHQLLESLEEQISLARESGCRLQVSQLQAIGQANWEKQAQALLEETGIDGINVEFDSYPYLAGSTVLTQLLPWSAMAGGIPRMLQLLSSPVDRKAIALISTDRMAQQWSDIFIASIGSERNRHLVGKSFAGLANERGMTRIDPALDLLIEEKGVVNILPFNQSGENLRKLLTHPLCTEISGGFSGKGRPHPRLHSTFPCPLGEIVRQRGWISLPQATHKITGKATYETPELAPDGVKLVFRGGIQVTPQN